MAILYATKDQNTRSCFNEEQGALSAWPLSRMLGMLANTKKDLKNYCWVQREAHKIRGRLMMDIIVVNNWSENRHSRPIRTRTRILPTSIKSIINQCLPIRDQVRAIILIIWPGRLRQEGHKKVQSQAKLQGEFKACLNNFMGPHLKVKSKKKI